MIGPSTIEVLLHVPDWVHEGLVRGDYKALGGTIRDKAGRLVALLTEGEGLSKLAQQGGAIDPKALMAVIGHAQTAMHLANGLGAINLVVSGVGFVMMRQRLDQIAGQLHGLAVELQDVKEESGWLSGLQMASLRGDIDTALDLAMRAQRQGHLETFRVAKTKTFEVRRRFHHTMVMMLDTRRVLPRYNVFGELAQASAILALSEAHCDEAIEGPGIALDALKVAQRDLNDLLTRFADQKKDFAADPKTMLALGSRGRREITSLQEVLFTIGHQLNGKVERLRAQADAGLSAEEWRNKTAPPGSGVMTCVVISRDAEASAQNGAQRR